MYSVIATWAFSVASVTRAAELLSAGVRALNAVEQGIYLTESDVDIDCVGRGGFLNRDGDLELDAAIMDGRTLRTGAVAGVRGYEHPVAIARRVMDDTRHNILIGAGAEQFAAEIGMSKAERDYLITEKAHKAWEEKVKAGHDTIGMVALDQSGDMAVATSTCGSAMKLPGRVGDSPIIGSGFYVQNGVGGASATGLGEDIMRTCCAFRLVELMRGGMNPRLAAENVVRTAHETIAAHGYKSDCIAVVCMNAVGEVGAAANHKGFAYVAADDAHPTYTVDVTPVIDKDAE